MSKNNITPLEFVDANDVKLFKKKYLMNEKPVIMKGFGKNWPAINRWSADFFKTIYGDFKVPVCYYKTKKQEPYEKQKTMALRDYINIAENNIAPDKNSEAPYLGGWIYDKEFPELLDDIDMSPPCFPDNWLHKLPPSISIPSTNLIIGYQQVSSPLHKDSFFVNSILTMIIGEKKARMVSPAHAFAVSNGQNLFDPEISSEILKQGVDIFEGTVSVGDAFYIPPGWWHNVINCGFTIAVQNLHVDIYRFPLFEQQIRSYVLPLLSNIENLGGHARKELLKTEKIAPMLLSHKIGDFIEHERQYINFLKKTAKKTQAYLKHLPPENRINPE